MRVMLRAAWRKGASMKIIVEYSILNGRPLERAATASGVKLLSEGENKPDHPANFRQQRIEYFVEEGSEAGRTICSLLGLTAPS